MARRGDLGHDHLHGRWRVRRGGWRERYGDLLTGSYDCVDRIVLNAFFPLGHNPGGFRTWWRRWHDGSDDDLDNTHLMRMAGRFARRVKAWGEANGVPVVYCRAGERKHQIAEEHLAAHPPSGPGVFLVLAAKAPASVWEVRRSESTGVIGNIAKHRARLPRRPPSRGLRPGSRSASSGAAARRQAATPGPGNPSPAGTRHRPIPRERPGSSYRAPHDQWPTPAARNRTSPAHRGQAPR